MYSTQIDLIKQYSTDLKQVIIYVVMSVSWELIDNNRTPYACMY